MNPWRILPLCAIAEHSFYRVLVWFCCLQQVVHSFSARPGHTTLYMSGEPGIPKEAARIRVLGICGGIGSGKSTVCQTLVSELGCLGCIGAWSWNNDCVQGADLPYNVERHKI